MAEPKPSLKLIDRITEGVEQSSNPAVRNMERKALERYLPSITKTVRGDAQRELLTKLGTQTLEEASQLTQLRQERDARPTLQEEAKHGRHQRWLGFAIGVPAGMVLACAAIFAMQGVIWDTATRSFREQAMTGALISSHNNEGRNDGYTNPGQDVTRRN